MIFFISVFIYLKCIVKVTALIKMREIHYTQILGVMPK